MAKDKASAAVAALWIASTMLHEALGAADPDEREVYLAHAQEKVLEALTLM